MSSIAVLTLFFCSGATALAYELIWSKYLALLFGSTIQAQTVVLAVFMGGLALGNKLFSRLADRAENPLAIYGRLEITIGIYALLFSLLYGVADWIFTSVGSSLLNHSGLLLILKGILSIALLLGPTVLMGGTLPVLAAWLQRSESDAGRRSARFYSVNSFGAVCGAGLTGFWLIESIGLRNTMDLGAAVNISIGAIALVIGGLQSATGIVHQAQTQTARIQESGARGGDTAFRMGCIMVAFTGAVSMGLEVLASRCLCLVFGASLQVFAIVLMAFILGISVGSAVIASPQWKRFNAQTIALVLLLVAATAVGLVVFNIVNLVGIYLDAQNGLSRTLIGYRFFEIVATVLSFCVLGLPAALLGAVLPLWIRAASDTSDLLGDRVGRLLTWNTLGAVGGSLLTGFVFMPVIGLRGSFTTLAAILVLAAMLVALTSRRELIIGLGAFVGAFLLVASFHGAQNWRYIFSAGAFRMADLNFTLETVLRRPEFVTLEFYEDAADATVSVEHVKGSEERSLRIDGKVDASSSGDGSTQLLLAYLSLMARPESKDVFCFGMGSGITAGATLNYPIDRLTVAENCAPVLRAAELFTRWNNGVLTNSRAHFYHEDARTVLKLSSQKYDVIISEPSNPWMVGVASVFTREFYQIAASRLKPGGIMTQWFHTYEMDDANVDVVLRTFESVFPCMEIWDAGDGDIIVLGSEHPWQSDSSVYAQALRLPGVRGGLRVIGLTSPVSILSRRLASQRTAFAIAGEGPMQRDSHPLLEYTAPRAFYLYLHRVGVFRILHFDERTWQIRLASDAANNDLSTLEPPELKAIFDSGQGSVNIDMMNYLHAQYNHYTTHAPMHPVVTDNHVMPCSLQGTNKMYGIYTPPSAATNALTHQLASAEYALATDPSKLSAIEDIEYALDATFNYHRQNADWSAAYYADLAVKACLRRQAYDRAKAILLRGLQLEPDSDELHYLSRILIREKILQPDDLSSPPALSYGSAGLVPGPAATK